MKTQKIKRYRLGVSRKFPKGHPRAGEETKFGEKILQAIGIYCCERIDSINGEIWNKLHTCRKNYEYWAKVMEEVLAGEAVIEMFYWSGKPYNSTQVVFATLDKYSGCGVQHLTFDSINLCERNETPLYATVYEPFAYKFSPTLIDLAKNDGLSLDDFKAWFKSYDLSKPLAIIHFTKFRY